MFTSLQAPVWRQVLRRCAAWVAFAPVLLVAACGGGGGSGGADETGTAPAFTSAPADATVVESQSANFSVTVTGEPAPSVRWEIKVPGQDAWQHLCSEANCTAFNVPLSNDGAKVHAVATNAEGSVTSAEATLHVVATPAIVAQPLEQSWRPGETEALFIARATGAELHYQWQGSTDGGTNFTDIDGATEASLLLSGAAHADVNAVRLRVSSLGVTVDSNPARLRRLTWRAVTSTHLAGQSLRDVAWADNGAVVAIGHGSTLLRSTDAGLNWTVVSEEPIERLKLERIAFNASGNVGLVTAESTMLRSADKGQHWVPLSAFSVAYPTGVAFGTAGTVLAVGYLGHIARSTDEGQTWSIVHTPSADRILNDVAIRPTGVALAVGSGGVVMRSTDGGVHWTQVRQDANDGLTRVTFASDTVVFAVRNDGKLLRSDDAGLSWVPVTAAYPYVETRSLRFASASEGIAVADYRLVVTHDGGQSWTEKLSTDAGWFYAAAYNPSQLLLAVGSDGAVSRSLTLGDSWSHLGPVGGFVIDLASLGSNRAVATGQYGALWSADAGATWNQSSMGPGVESLFALAPVDATTLVAVGPGANSASIARSVDSGKTWSVVNHGVQSNLYDVAFSHTGLGIAVGFANFARTTNGGASWQEIVTGPVSGANAVALNGSGTVGLAVGVTSGFQRTTDGGWTWFEVAPNLGVFKDVTFLSDSVAIAVGDGSGTIFRSTDGGQTWTMVRPQLGGLSYVSFRSSLEGVAVGPDGVMVRTSDGGLTWTDMPPMSRGIWPSAVNWADDHTVLMIDHGAIRRDDSF